MRVTSNCVNHPSREASTRCRSCGKWLCDRCVRRIGARVYCGRSCQLIGRIRTVLAHLVDAARRPIPAPWPIVVAASASALLLAAVGLKIGELVEINAALAPPPATAARSGLEAPSVEVRGDDQGRTVEIRGRPGERFVIVGSDGPTEIVTIDENGIGVSRELTSRSQPTSFEIVPMATRATTVEVPAAAPPPTPRPTLTATPRPRPSADRQRRASTAPRFAPPVLQLVDDAGPRIAITFDGDASSNRTDELLDLLQKLDLKATLFVTGRFIERHPAVVRRAVLAGHEIGNHTYSHPHLTSWAENRRHRTLPGVDRRTLQRELEKTERAFRAATGRAMQPLWRSPYGEENREIRGWALEIGYLHVRWSSLQGASLDTRDWVDDEHSALYQNSQRIMDRLLAFPKLEGGIILMHLATERAEAPWAKLPEFVTALRQRGVEPTRVSELLEASPSWQPWLQRARANHRGAHGG